MVQSDQVVLLRTGRLKCRDSISKNGAMNFSGASIGGKGNLNGEK